MKENSIEQTKETVVAFDIIKWICAFLVLFLHCEPLAPYSSIMNLYTKDGICRIGVPIFYAISGYLLFDSKMKWGGYVGILEK